MSPNPPWLIGKSKLIGRCFMSQEGLMLHLVARDFYQEIACLVNGSFPFPHPEWKSLLLFFMLLFHGGKACFCWSKLWLQVGCFLQAKCHPDWVTKKLWSGRCRWTWQWKPPRFFTPKKFCPKFRDYEAYHHHPLGQKFRDHVKRFHPYP